MDKKETRIAICPKCGRPYHGAPALSRLDNETLICSDCGTREALESIGVSASEQEQILNIIHRYDDPYREEVTSVEEELALGSVPVSVAAKVYGKDPCWVRAGIIAGWLPIGRATRDGKLITSIEQMNSRYGRISYYISPKLLYEQTGYIWKGKNRE